MGHVARRNPDELITDGIVKGVKIKGIRSTQIQFRQYDLVSMNNPFNGLRRWCSYGDTAKTASIGRSKSRINWVESLRLTGCGWD
jgi:hypothetical protein